MSPSAKSQSEIVIISPHRDDAAFSCAIVILAGLKSWPVRIINVFTRSAYAPFDVAVEQQGSEAVTDLRQQEDECCARLLRAMAGPDAEWMAVDLRLLDAPLRLGLPAQDVQGRALDAAEFEREVHSVATILRPELEGAACVLLPLGLGGTALEGHIDHRIVRDAGQRCVSPDRVAFYEDLPYAARMSQTVCDSAVQVFTSRFAGVQPVSIQHADAGHIKAKLARCYRSQVDATTIEEMAVYTRTRGGERVYAAPSARGVLEAL